MRKQQHTKRSKAWTICCFLLSCTIFYLGLVLLFFGSGFGNSYLMQQNADEATKALTKKDVYTNQKHKTTYDAKKTKSINTANLLKARQTNAYAIGKIAIPAVNIHNPLFAGYGDQNQNLAYGVVTCLPDRTMGGANNYVLAGHYMGSAGPAVLDNLHLAKPNDLIYVTNLKWIYIYQIKTISFAIKPTQVEVENNINKQRLITLITCSDFNTSKYGYGQHRTVVQGKMIGKIKATNQNLIATELMVKPKKVKAYKQIVVPVKKKKIIIKQVKTRVKPKFYQKMNNINWLIIGFNIVFVIFVIWQLVRITKEK